MRGEGIKQSTHAFATLLMVSEQFFFARLGPGAMEPLLEVVGAGEDDILGGAFGTIDRETQGAFPSLNGAHTFSKEASYLFP